MNSNPKGTPREGGWQGLIYLPLIHDSIGLLSPSPSGFHPFSLTNPARLIPSKRRSMSGVVPFQSLKRTLRFESTLERDLLILLRHSQPWIGALEQPLKLDRKPLGFGSGTYTPDLLVWLREGEVAPREVVLIEVKPEAVLKKDWKKFRPKLMAGRRLARNQGWRFLLITERHLRVSVEPLGSWPRIHSEDHVLAEPSSILHRLFGRRVA